MSNDFKCDKCFDTRTIDFGGREVPCPHCQPLPRIEQVKLTGLAHGLGLSGDLYTTAIACSSTSITFRGTRNRILDDVRNVRLSYEGEARRRGLKGRNSVSSGPIAIEKRVKEALK